MATAASTAARVAQKLMPISIGPAIDKLNALREKKRKLEAQVSEVEAEYKDLEELLMEKLEAEGSRTGAGKTATASISQSVVGNVTDWEKVNAFIKKTGFFHLYQRRLSDAAVRELFDQGKKIPGCEPFIKKRLNLRAGV